MTVNITTTTCRAPYRRLYRNDRARSGSESCATVAILLMILFVAPATAQAPDSTGFGSEVPASVIDNPLGIPDVRGIIPTASDGKGVSASLQVLVLLTVLTLVPSLLIMTTSFPRIIIVLSLLRQAVGTQQLPPSQILLGLSLFVTLAVMAPTWHRVYVDAAEPYFDNQMGQREAFAAAEAPIREFMYRQIEKSGNFEDVYMFLEYTEKREIAPDEEIDVSNVSLSVMIPAFMLSELKTAFIMGFRIYLPFLVIDMVIATILLSMGMMMLPPVLISLPFKILLFVLADGWHLVVESLLFSFV